MPLVRNMEGTGSTANGPNPSISLAFRVTGYQLTRSTLSSSLRLIRGRMWKERKEEEGNGNESLENRAASRPCSRMKQAARSNAIRAPVPPG